MKNKTISITDELYIKLATEENASGLIVSLLEKHYSKSNKTEEQIITETKEAIQQKEQEAKDLIIKKEKEQEGLKISEYIQTMSDEERQLAREMIIERKVKDLQDYAKQKLHSRS